MAENNEPLLLTKEDSGKKKEKYDYYENCPGCQVEKSKAENTNVPWLQFFFIWIITLASGNSFFFYKFFSFFSTNKSEN